MTEQNEPRLRPHPAERFAGTEAVIHLDEVFEELAGEDHPGNQGHRQITVFKRGPVTMVAFLFERDGLLPEHSARGLVTIQAIVGELLVDTPGEEYRLEEQMCVILAPNVPHSVRAVTPSKMLLTVHLEESQAGEAR
ncbi:MAG: cupin domain-containing protein [Bradymonadaceae bacterium]